MKRIYRILPMPMMEQDDLPGGGGPSLEIPIEPEPLPDLAESAAEAAALTLQTQAAVETMQLQTANELITSIKTIMDELQNLTTQIRQTMEQAQTNLEQTESLKAEALEIVEALKPTDPTSENLDDPDSATMTKTGTLKDRLLSLLA